MQESAGLEKAGFDLTEVQIDMNCILCRPYESYTQQLSPGFPEELALRHDNLAVPDGAGRDIYRGQLILQTSQE